MSSNSRFKSSYSYVYILSALEKSKRSQNVNIDDFIVEEDGEYIVFMPQIRGEADIKVNDVIVASHRFAGNYRLSYAFAFKTSLKTGDKLNISFLNPNDTPGHHGIVFPLYGVSYNPIVQIVSTKLL